MLLLGQGLWSQHQVKLHNSLENIRSVLQQTLASRPNTTAFYASLILS